MKKKFTLWKKTIFMLNHDGGSIFFYFTNICNFVLVRKKFQFNPLMFVVDMWKNLKKLIHFVDTHLYPACI